MNKLILNKKFIVMGILNMTPDSFFDGGKYNRIDLAIDHVAEMIDDGATIIDIGGESSRPGANTISDEEEAERVIPVIIALKKRFNTFISVDTSKALIIRESAKAGAHLINDIRALKEPGSLEAAVESKLYICLMHMKGEPRTMHQNTFFYRNVLEDVINFFKKNIFRCETAGIKKNRLLIDPGFGFGKNLSQNYFILGRLSELHNFGLPLVVGMSRKSMIGKLMDLSPKQRIFGSIACAVIAAMQKVQIIRVHDVRATVEALRVVTATLAEKEGYFQ